MHEACAHYTVAYISQRRFPCVEQFYDNSYLPQDPISFILFLLVIISYQDHSTDAGIELMMIFFNQVLMLCGSSYRFPKKITTFKVWARLSERLFDGIKPFVMCQDCHAMYPYRTDEEIMQINGKRCRYKDTLSNSVRCGNELFVPKKTTSTSRNTTLQIPKKMFFYNSVAETIKKFLKRADFVYQLENRKASIPGFYSDIKDGSAFQNFRLPGDGDQESFVNASDYNLLLTINVDWFSLSKGLGGSTFTLGGIYATVQNLERGQRNKSCNSILIAILPGPKEATMSQMNRYKYKINANN